MLKNPLGFLPCLFILPFSAPAQTRQSSVPVASPTPAGISVPRYSSAFGIDYRQPEKYLAQGEQTRLSNPAVINPLRGKTPSLAHLGEIYFWIKREFTPWSAGGQTIGAVTSDQLMSERRLGGCHDWALIYASIARELGYPAVMVDAAGVGWAKTARAGGKGPYLGHVFVEVYVGGRWVLVDSTNNWFVESNYDPANGMIPLTMGNETEGMFVLRKGADSWGYHIRSNAELTRLMDESARQLDLTTRAFPAYRFHRFQTTPRPALPATQPRK